MTPKNLIEQLNAAQSEFEDKVSKLAMTASRQKNPYRPGIARCVAILNALASARRFDWEGSAVASGLWKPSESSEGLSTGGCETLADADLPPAPS